MRDSRQASCVGSGHRFEGQAMTYVPGHGPCYRCLFPEPPADGLVSNCAEPECSEYCRALLGAIQATEAIKLMPQTVQSSRRVNWNSPKRMSIGVVS